MRVSSVFFVCLLAFKSTSSCSFCCLVLPGSRLNNSGVFSINMEAARFILNYWQQHTCQSNQSPAWSCRDSSPLLGSDPPSKSLNSADELMHMCVLFSTIVVSEPPVEINHNTVTKRKIRATNTRTFFFPFFIFPFQQTFWVQKESHDELEHFKGRLSL